MIQPTALNVLIIGLSVIIFQFLARMLAARFSEHPFGQALAVVL